ECCRPKVNPSNICGLLDLSCKASDTHPLQILYMNNIQQTFNAANEFSNNVSQEIKTLN
ncbi:unnamed protein product, partial [Heterotrigona itama]